MKRTTLIKNLQKRAMRITFTKVNGEERIMDCSLQEHIVPETSESNRKQNKEILPVFDINKGEWRSFRLDSVTNIEALEYQDNEVL
ncbi:MAG: SH3 beta-barrel fold-containing protein [Candidatus Pacebacteria bacterium]|jgi:predicted DNA-binding protein (MmcQ/YjbR family)|nr:SH3 beta-barrel fold-containing protein [Candidatus Paceibacterota bacterium]|tara:strand:- start:1992 stop:2249 length:258 start_codon:yes stop_codon:yes gene_type:complete